MDFKTIGESITWEEFCSFVLLLRANMNINKKINIEENEVWTDYCGLYFDFSDASLLDNGIFITNKTKQNSVQIHLYDYSFNHSTYSLTFKVMDIEDYRIYENEGTDISFDLLTVPLIKGGSVYLDFSDIENGSVILLDDVNLRITHDEPTISIPSQE